jgi:hypothetical protein
MSIVGREEERCPPILVLMVDVTTSFNEHLRDRRMPIFGREAERCAPRLLLMLDVTPHSKELFRNVHISVFGRDVERQCTHHYPGGRRYRELQLAGS